MPTIRRVNLTAAALIAAKPKPAHYRLWDARVPGLCLRVLKSGGKTFEVHWGAGSKSLGKFPVTTLEAARTQALLILSDAAENGTPEVAKTRAKVSTLRDFIVSEFQPWASANLKWGDEETERILSAFTEFADRPLTSINAWTIEKWRSKKIKTGIKPNTCNRDLAALKSALRRALKWKLIAADPLTDVKQSKVDSTRVRFLSGDEEKRLRGRLSKRDAEGRAARARGNAWRTERGRGALVMLRDHDYVDHLTPAVLLSLNTGLRRGELTALEWSDVNLPRKLLTVRAAAAKSGKSRHIPLNVEAHAVLKQWQRQRGADGQLFPIRDMKTAWNALLAEAKVEGFRWHDMRHDFASKLVMAGVNLNAVRELLGHADLKMTLRYAHLAPSHLADAVAMLGAAR